MRCAVRRVQRANRVFVAGRVRDRETRGGGGRAAGVCFSGFRSGQVDFYDFPAGGDADMPFSEMRCDAMRCDAIRYGVAGGNWVWSDGRCRSPIDRVS